MRETWTLRACVTTPTVQRANQTMRVDRGIARRTMARPALKALGPARAPSLSSSGLADARPSAATHDCESFHSRFAYQLIVLACQ